MFSFTIAVTIELGSEGWVGDSVGERTFSRENNMWKYMLTEESEFYYGWSTEFIVKQNRKKWGWTSIQSFFFFPFSKESHAEFLVKEGNSSNSTNSRIRVRRD